MDLIIFTECILIILCNVLMLHKLANLMYYEI